MGEIYRETKTGCHTTMTPSEMMDGDDIDTSTQRLWTSHPSAALLELLKERGVNSFFKFSTYRCKIYVTK